MDQTLATMILMGLNILQSVIDMQKQPIVDADGNVIASNLKAFAEMKSSDEIFKEVTGETRDEFLGRVNTQLSGGDTK